jgi:hypothetical protein
LEEFTLKPARHANKWMLDVAREKNHGLQSFWLELTDNTEMPFSEM